MSELLLRGGRVVDPVNDIDGPFDVLVRDGRIVQVGRDLSAPSGDVITLGNGMVVCPGLVDMHVHLREPGHEHKETIATGTAAALAGGFTSVACMPNTDPVNDQASVTEFILKKAAQAGLARVYPIGAVSRGSEGLQLAEIGDMRHAGCVAVSDDSNAVATALLMRRALEYAGMFGMPVIDHCEDASLRGDGVAHEGFHAGRLGLKGIPAIAEEMIVERDVTIAGAVGGRLHIAHVSTRGALRAVRSGKDRGVAVTCEATPHHFVLTDEALAGYDTNVKTNPPLREAADRDALIEGLRDGSIDVIATDHAPHHYDEKRVEFDRAPFGIVGLETAVSLVLDRLVHTGVITLKRFVELLSSNPARILDISAGTLSPGAAADITILASDMDVSVRSAEFRSRSRNTPFEGWRLRGGVAATFVGGRPLYVSERSGLQLAVAY